ncbi:hypothetical protein ACFXJ5_17070 [Streptomyces sp. NPDC059373]
MGADDTGGSPSTARRSTDIGIGPRGVRSLRPVPADATAGDIAALWAEQQVAALGPNTWPEYGTAAWVRLRAEDPRRAAAIVEAAELWRRQRARESWLDQLLDDDPDRWFAIITEDANAEAVRIAPALARGKTNAELRAARARRPAHEIRATAGWSPIAIPGRPGWRRHLIDGQQADLPDTRREAG